MFPQFEFLGKSIGMYALLALIGAFLCGILFCYMIRKNGLNDNEAIAFLLFVSLGVMIGGHALFGLTNIRYFPLLFERTDFSVWIQRIGLLFGGSVFYGGLIGGLVAGIIVIRVMKLPLTFYADHMAPIIPLFHGIARIGCFLGGCCYGIESKFGFTAHNNSFVPEINDISRFPVQLLESVCNFIIAIILFRLLKLSSAKSTIRGKLLYIYLILYACIRFFDEMLRADTIRGFVGPLSTSQWISIFIFIIGLVALIISTRKQADQYSELK